jgi:hypothetical protein
MWRASVSRRLFLAGGICLGARALPPPKEEAVYSFATAECGVRLTVEFHDRYSSSGFSFQDLSADRRFCLSASGEAERNCAAGFVGSLAIARYRFRPHSESGRIGGLREHVRTIDQDAGLRYRPPFDRTIELREGVASDIQAFGYETAPPPSPTGPMVPDADSGGPWYYFRQDLYFGGRPTAFLVIHWRHTFSAIRILDVIPGDGTWAVKQAQ